MHEEGAGGEKPAPHLPERKGDPAVTTEDLRQIGELMDEKLAPIYQRFDGVEQRLDKMELRLGDAIMVMANNWPGTMPGHKSHVARKVEKILTA